MDLFATAIRAMIELTQEKSVKTCIDSLLNRKQYIEPVRTI